MSEAVPTVADSLRTRKRWTAPVLARIDSRSAENNSNPIDEDGLISMGS